MGVIIGVIVGYVMGTKAGDHGLEELKDAWHTIRSSEEAKDIIGGRAVDGRQSHQQGWWIAGRAVPGLWQRFIRCDRLRPTG